MPSKPYDLEPDGTPHTEASGDVNTIIGYLRDIFESYVEQIGYVGTGDPTHSPGSGYKEMLAANGTNLHSHYAYRMVEYGKCKQLTDVLFGTYNRAGTKTMYGLNDIILKYSPDVQRHVCAISYDISDADSSSTPIATEHKVKGCGFTLPRSTDIEPKGGDELLGWYVRAEDYYSASTLDKKPYLKRDILLDFGDTLVAPTEKNALTVRLRTGKRVNTIQFSLNGGTGEAPRSILAKAGDIITFPSAAGIIAPVGKYFVGWALTAAALTPEYTPGQTLQYTGLFDTVYAVYSATAS